MINYCILLFNIKIIVVNAVNRDLLRKCFKTYFCEEIFKIYFKKFNRYINVEKLNNGVTFEQVIVMFEFNVCVSVEPMYLLSY